MSNLNNTNTIESHNGKKGQVNNLHTDSQPDPTETLDVGPPTSIAHKFLIFFYFIWFFGMKDC